MWEVGHPESVPWATMKGMTPADPAPVQLVVGEEEFLVERAVQDVVARARSTDPAVEVRRFRASELTPVDLADILSPSLFADGRVVVLQNAHEAGKDLATALVEEAARPVEGIVLVIVHSGGARNKAMADALRKAGAKVTTCARLTRAEERSDFVRAEVRRLGGKVEPAAIGVVLEAVGSDLRELASAVSQLVADTDGRVDEAAVRRYYRGRAESSGFAVADKVVVGDRTGALEALRWAQQLGVPSVLVADALADAVRTLAKVGAAGRGDPNRLAGMLGMPPWKIRKAQREVRGWRPEALAAAFAAAAEVNADVKGVAADAGYALERAVLRMCDARNGS
jgi:DNA polymerase-3 subunit delta